MLILDSYISNIFILSLSNSYSVFLVHCPLNSFPSFFDKAGKVMQFLGIQSMTDSEMWLNLSERENEMRAIFQCMIETQKYVNTKRNLEKVEFIWEAIYIS